MADSEKVVIGWIFGYLLEPKTVKPVKGVESGPFGRGDISHGKQYEFEFIDKTQELTRVNEQNQFEKFYPTEEYAQSLLNETHRYNDCKIIKSFIEPVMGYLI